MFWLWMFAFTYQFRVIVRPKWLTLTVVIIMVVNVLFTSLDQLLQPGMLLYFVQKGHGALAFTWMSVLGMGSQLFASMRQVPLVRRWTLKRVLIGITLAWLATSIFRLFSFWEDLLILMLLSAVMGAAMGMIANMSIGLQLRRQLGKDHIAGKTLLAFVLPLIQSVIIWLGLTFHHVLLWQAVHVMGLILCLILLLLIWKRLNVEEEAQERSEKRAESRLRLRDRAAAFCERFRDPAMLRDRVAMMWERWFHNPATLIACGEFGLLIAVYALPKLLPVIHEGRAATILFWAPLVVAVGQLILNGLMDRRRGYSGAWLLLFTRGCLVLGLICLFLGVVEGAWKWIILGILFWGVGSCCKTISSNAGYARAEPVEKGTVANALPEILWNVAGILGAFYIGFWQLESSSAQATAEIAVWWLLVPLGASVLWTLFWLVVNPSSHHLPPKQEN